jgi:hypothetical protein
MVKPVREVHDVHIYKNGKYIRTDRDVPIGEFVDYGEGEETPSKISEDTPALPENPVGWPEGSEL